MKWFKPKLEEMAKQNMSLAGKGVKDFTPLERVNEKLSNVSGLSHMQLHKAQAIIEKAPEELIREVRINRKTINYAYKQVKRSEDDKKEKPPLPEGQYDVILADPPWEYDINTRGSPDEHYAVMKDDAIQNLKVPAADSSAILFLWATMPKLREALDVMEAWGFEYRTGAAWYKDKIGTGYYFRGQFELLLLGVKGKGIGVLAEADRPSSVIIAPRKEHSQKPDEVYEIIERMYPGRKYIELFQRGKPRKGWTTWGVEAQQQ